jgi:hypothetical protein
MGEGTGMTIELQARIRFGPSGDEYVAKLAPVRIDEDSLVCVSADVAGRERDTPVTLRLTRAEAKALVLDLLSHLLR